MKRLVRVWPIVPLALVALILVLRALVTVTPNIASGELHVWRPGPVIVGFQSTRHETLLVQGKKLDGHGIVKDRFVIQEPTIHFAFDSAPAPDTRLIWSPVGRRGDPEYVTASNLTTDLPDHDGVFSVLLLLVVIGSILFAMRERLAAVSRETWIALGAVFVLALIVRLIGIDAHGQTWDEDTNWAAGENYITNLLALDFHKSSWVWNYEHPPVMKYLVGIGAHIGDTFNPARAICALLVSLGCALMVLIGTRLANLRTGVLAGLIAALLPPLVAHGQIVGHEAPTVLWWALGILLALCAHDDPKKLPQRLAGVGIVVGVAVASRFVNGLLGPLCVAIVLLKAPADQRKRTLVWSPIMVATTIASFYFLWPRLWGHPFHALGESLHKLSLPHVPEPFLGHVTNMPPAYYFLVYLFATLPLGVLIGVIVGIVRGARERTRDALILLAWFVIPLLVAASPVRQDGVRYVMPSVMALAMTSAYGFDWLATRLKHARAFTAICAALVIYLGITLARVSPYYLDYFSELTGGASSVQERGLFETAWWGEGLDRAITYVNEHAKAGELVDRSCVVPQHLTWFRGDLWPTVVNDPSHATWIVEYVGARCRVPPGAQKVFQVSVQGAPLARVWHR
ncbi:MAG TPA: glycosyltransferase family 39 protein [Kofleriaceae bacterium]